MHSEACFCYWNTDGVAFFSIGMNFILIENYLFVFFHFKNHIERLEIFWETESVISYLEDKFQVFVFTRKLLLSVCFVLEQLYSILFIFLVGNTCKI